MFASAAPEWDKDMDVHLWETATRKERLRIKSRLGAASLAFSPDGRTLSLGGNDTSVLLYDLADLPLAAKDPPAEPDGKQLDALWAKLADSDASIAFQAMSGFVHAPEKAVPYLKDHLQAGAGDELRQARAVEALERIGTPEAQELLKVLAKGMTNSRLTREAKASSERLSK